ncbi:alpha/beta fold hydrolase [Paludisphaera rhizosphaerae]|uniref:alpha/beta fold hydrolase n=1 Tax=Paludisphaera rhizosphaerae TaxID=2711216 RepID=UPI0013E9A5D0|nr:alpha/beta fold hydrolase [Paludisphaera rhizosphaerae]
MLLAYTDQGTGPVVVLLHGFPLSRAMWDAQVHALSASHRVVAPDLRGHGESPAPDGTYTMDQMADDVAELLDGLGIVEPVVLGGLSMGGYVALAFALKHPNRLRGLILADTRAAADAPEAARLREETAQSVSREGRTATVVETMIPRLFARTTLQNRPGLVSAMQEVMERTSASGVIGALLGMARRPDRRDRLGEIIAPTLVVVGQEDVVSPPEEARAIAEALPNSQLAIIPHAGHLAPYEDPEAFNAVVLAFLKDVHPHA